MQAPILKLAGGDFTGRIPGGIGGATAAKSRVLSVEAATVVRVTGGSVILISLHYVMSLEKLAALADEFVIKLAEYHYDDSAPADKKASDFGPEEASFIKSVSKKDNNPAQDEGNAIDEKTWKRAKKTVKKYWNKYDEPWAVVYDVYRKMGGGKPKKKSKKK